MLNIHQILSRKVIKISSVSEFINRCVNSSFRNHGNQLIWSIYQGTHNSIIDDSKRNNRDINVCNNSVHRLKKNGIRIMNHDKMKNVAMIYVIKIQIHLFFVSLCQNITTHSNAREIINAAITIYKYDKEMYIIYPITTTHNHTNRNLIIFFVVIDDSIYFESSFSNKWVVGISIFGVGKRFSFFTWNLVFRDLKLSLHDLIVCLDCCRRFFIFVSIEMFEKN